MIPDSVMVLVAAVAFTTAAALAGHLHTPTTTRQDTTDD